MRKCIFCGCTDDAPCMIPMRLIYPDDILGRPAHTVFNFEPVLIPGFTTPCHWIAPEICSAPRCVDLAYLQLSVAVDNLIAFQDAA